MKYLGIDYGTKWVGLAISDDEGKFAFPLFVWKNEGQVDLTKKIADLATEKKIKAIVLGKSVNLDGSDNELMKDINILKENLVNEGLEVHLQNEIYTTSQSRRLHHKREPRSRKQLNQARLDATAAALILQGWLDGKGL